MKAYEQLDRQHVDVLIVGTVQASPPMRPVGASPSELRSVQPRLLACWRNESPVTDRASTGLTPIHREYYSA